MLTMRRAAIKGEWIAPGALCLPLDFDSYFATSAFAVCSKFYSDDKDQLYWFKENGRIANPGTCRNDPGIYVIARLIF
jgi:hypothetical protein